MELELQNIIKVKGYRRISENFAKIIRDRMKNLIRRIDDLSVCYYFFFFFVFPLFI